MGLECLGIECLLARAASPASPPTLPSLPKLTVAVPLALSLERGSQASERSLTGEAQLVGGGRGSGAQAQSGAGLVVGPGE